MILIGSRSLALRLPQALNRSPLDFDFIGTKEEYDHWFKTNEHKIKPTEIYPEMNGDKMIVKGEGTICEFEFIKPGSSNELLVDLVNKDPETIETSFGKIPNKNLLFTIKDSHKYKKFNQSSNQFWKTAVDWHSMKRLGCYIPEEYKEFHQLREKESYAAQKHPKLNVSKENFFKDDGLEYIFNHDDLHEAIKLYDRPAYTYYLKENQPVLCDKSKFFSVPESIRLAGGLEEGLTLSLERSYIPHKNVWQPDQIFKFAIAKVASTITSGFFREYVYHNIFNILKLYEQTSKDYCDKFETALAAGKVRPFSGSKY